MGVYPQYLGLNFGIDTAGCAEHNEKSWNDGDKDQCQLPLRSESDHERRHEGGDGLDDNAEFLCDARLNKLPIRGSLLGNRAGEASVVEGDVLAQCGSKVALSNVAGEIVCNVGRKGSVNVGGDEADDAYVNEVETTCVLACGTLIGFSKEYVASHLTKLSARRT